MRVKGKNDLLPFQRGLLLSCNALPQLHRFVSNKFPDDDTNILTYHLSQDVLELLFGMWRIAGRTHTNPDAVNLKRRVRKTLLGRNPELLLGETSVALNRLEVDYDPIVTVKVIRVISKNESTFIHAALEYKISN